MVEQAAPWLWGGVALGVAVLVARSRRRAPPPTVVAIGTGVVFALVAAALGASWRMEAAWFVGVAVVLRVLFARWRALQADDRLPVGVGGNRLVGMVGQVVEPVTATTGRVRVAEETWRAVAAPDGADDPGAVPIRATERVGDDAPGRREDDRDAMLDVGAEVLVVAVRGTQVRVVATDAPHADTDADAAAPTTAARPAPSDDHVTDPTTRREPTP